VNYYNEWDKYAAQWLRNAIAEKLIPDGVVDERSITDVSPADLDGFIQCHFFAGIGGWSLAARLAGWPDDRELWTGSAPCQPYSVASVAHGGAIGQADKRHLSPELVRLIRAKRPRVIHGEQVASAIAWGWLDDLFADLENEGYTTAAFVLPALAVGANHERKRLYWMADTSGEGRPGHKPVECVSVPTGAAFALYGDVLADARRALDGDYSHLLPCDGLSVAVERCATKGYGNAIVPQLAAQVLSSYLECRP